jgi:hypothetical protein
MNNFFNMRFVTKKRGAKRVLSLCGENATLLLSTHAAHSDGALHKLEGRVEADLIFKCEAYKALADRYYTSF